MRHLTKNKVNAFAPVIRRVSSLFYFIFSCLLCSQENIKKMLLDLLIPFDYGIQFYCSVARLKCHKIKLFYYILHIITIYSATICKFVFN